jgi:hypothetical protein
VLLTEALKLVFASVALRDSHANILEEATTGICSLVHTFADFLRIHLYVLRLSVRPRGESPQYDGLFAGQPWIQSECRRAVNAR